jgi:hypothetical protein
VDVEIKDYEILYTFKLFRFRLMDLFRCALFPSSANPVGLITIMSINACLVHVNGQCMVDDSLCLYYGQQTNNEKKLNQIFTSASYTNLISRSSHYNLLLTYRLRVHVHVEGRPSFRYMRCLCIENLPKTHHDITTH